MAPVMGQGVVRPISPEVQRFAATVGLSLDLASRSIRSARARSCEADSPSPAARRRRLP